MKSVSNIIMGFFWIENEISAYQFIGEINITKNGKFTGWVKDVFGKATIEGKLQGIKLEFTKKYFLGTMGAREPISYLLHAQTYDDAKKIIYGGWKGVYKINSDYPNDNGKAACMIHPRS